MNANDTAKKTLKIASLKNQMAYLQRSCIANLTASLGESGFDLSGLLEAIEEERLRPEYFDDTAMREVFEIFTKHPDSNTDKIIEDLQKWKVSHPETGESWLDAVSNDMDEAKENIRLLAEKGRVARCEKQCSDALQKYESGEITAGQYAEISQMAYKWLLDCVCSEPDDDEYGPTLDDLGPQIPEEENPNVLIRDDFLKIGGSMILVAPAGAGKSTISMQMAYAWALGRDAFGLRPARPLRIGVFQTEDDNDALKRLRDGIKLGYKKHLGWTDEDLAKANSNVRYPKVKGWAWEEIKDKIRRLQRGKKKFDLIILNPLQGFTVGIDISDNSSLSEFLRVDLERIISDENMGCGLFIVHHTTKPTKDRDKTYLDHLYSGSGGNELTNWVRSKLMMDKSGDKYKLQAVKHGEELPWREDHGFPTVTICRAPKGSKEIFWSMDPPDQLTCAGTASAATSAPAQPEKGDDEIVAEALRANGETTLTEARKIAQTATSQRRGIDALKKIQEKPEKYGLTITKTGEGSKQIVTPMKQRTGFITP